MSQFVFSEQPIWFERIFALVSESESGFVGAFVDLEISLKMYHCIEVKS